MQPPHVNDAAGKKPGKRASRAKLAQTESGPKSRPGTVPAAASEISRRTTFEGLSIEPCVSQEASAGILTSARGIYLQTDESIEPFLKMTTAK
jgi:hypothetical protein